MDSPGTEPAGAIEEANFIANMAELRKARGWSQGELAKRMQDAGWDKFHQTTISRIEKGVQPVRLGEARGIADALDVDVAVMLMRSDMAAKLRDYEALYASISTMESEFSAQAKTYFVSGQILRLKHFMLLSELEKLESGSNIDRDEIPPPDDLGTPFRALQIVKNAFAEQQIGDDPGAPGGINELRDGSEAGPGE